jgi:hypothetical protein
MNMMDRPYWFRLLIGIDQFFNVVSNGDPDETISSRLGRRHVAGNMNWKHPLSMIIFIGLEKISAGHCVRSIGQ